MGSTTVIDGPPRARAARHLCGAMLWRKPLAQLADADVPWAVLEAPGDPLKLPSAWSYADMFACDDGSVLTIIGSTMYCLPEGEWKRVDNNIARRIVKTTVRGHEMFGALRTAVAGFKETVARLDTLG